MHVEWWGAGMGPRGNFRACPRALSRVGNPGAPRGRPFSAQGCRWQTTTAWAATTPASWWVLEWEPILLSLYRGDSTRNGRHCRRLASAMPHPATLVWLFHPDTAPRPDKARIFDRACRRGARIGREPQWRRVSTAFFVRPRRQQSRAAYGRQKTTPELFFIVDRRAGKNSPTRGAMDDQVFADQGQGHEGT